MIEIPEANEADYVAAQGGVPKVKKRDGLFVVSHDYQGGEGMEVASHRSVDDYGEVQLNVGGVLKRFKIALLRAFHGEPCERSSQAIGGSGAKYDRKKK